MKHCTLCIVSHSDLRGEKSCLGSPPGPVYKDYALHQLLTTAAFSTGLLKKLDFHLRSFTFNSCDRLFEAMFKTAFIDSICNKRPVTTEKNLTILSKQNIIFRRY